MASRYASTEWAGLSPDAPLCAIISGLGRNQQTIIGSATDQRSSSWSLTYWRLQILEWYDSKISWNIEMFPSLNIKLKSYFENEEVFHWWWTFLWLQNWKDFCKWIFILFWNQCTESVSKLEADHCPLRLIDRPRTARDARISKTDKDTFRQPDDYDNVF